MIKLHRLNDKAFLVNCDMIEYIEETPNTVISMLSGRKIVVEETGEEVVRLVIEFKRKVFAQGPPIMRD